MPKPATLQDYSDFLANYLPDKATPIIADFLFKNKISLKTTRRRATKLGDYAAPNPLKGLGHRITINHNLDKNTFLWVMLHEIAHYQVFIKYNRSVKPHGDEFQAALAKNLRFFNERHCFPAETEELIHKYYSLLPLKKSVEQKIEREFKDLAGIDVEERQNKRLADLPEGACFLLRKRIFKKLEKRRTRCKCLCLNNNRLYLVSLEADVQPIDIEKMK
ncbi:MAG: SprT-like domain-containing protein [Bacteroidales bacterium]|nr:SprT-like domain-containing protein [Bacteroidales bacterium]